MINKLLSITFILILFFETAVASINSPVLAEIDSVVENVLDTFKVPGVAVGIIVDGKILMARGYGYRDLDQKLPVTENTLFGIGSCTKAFTAFILGQLVEEGKIKWDDPVVKYIPELSLMDTYATSSLTIRDIIAHRSGLPRHDFIWFTSQFTKNDVVKALKHLEPSRPLREKFEYNNLMYAVAGLIIEKITGQSWEEVVTARIFLPIGMTNSNSSDKEAQESSNYSMPYDALEGKTRVVPFQHLDAIAPAVSIYSNVSDMLKWLQLHLSEGKLVKKETLEELHTLQMPLPVGAFPHKKIYEFGYGLGWFTGMYRGNYYLNHKGQIDGFISQISLLPEKQIGVIVLTNSSACGSSIVTSITHTIIDKLLEVEEDDWIEKSKKHRWVSSQAKRDEIPIKRLSSLELSQYIGLYEHDAYGTIEILLENDQLRAKRNEIFFSLYPLQESKFLGVFDKIFFGEKCLKEFMFFKDEQGTISTLEIPLEESVRPTVFKKK